MEGTFCESVVLSCGGRPETNAYRLLKLLPGVLMPVYVGSCGAMDLISEEFICVVAVRA